MNTYRVTGTAQVLEHAALLWRDVQVAVVVRAENGNDAMERALDTLRVEDANIRVRWNPLRVPHVRQT